MPPADSQAFLRELDSAKFPAGTELKERGRLAHSYKITSTGKLIDLSATIPFQHADLHAKDILGQRTASSPSKSWCVQGKERCASRR